MPIAIETCRRRLGTLWFCSFALLLAVMAIQSFEHVFDPDVQQAWGWFVQALMPTLGLMAAVFVAEATDAGKKTGSGKATEVDSFFFWLTLGASAIYLLLVASSLLWPTDMPRLDLMKQGTLLLGAWQGVTSTLLGIFFIRAKQGGARRAAAGKAKPAAPSQDTDAAA